MVVILPTTPCTIAVSVAQANVDTLFVAWPGAPGDFIVAYHVFDHTTVRVLGDDILSLASTVSQEDWGGGFWEQQWHYGVRGAEAGDNFYLSAAADQMVVVLAFSSDGAGGFLGGGGNDTFQIVENSPTITSPVSQPVAASSLMVTSTWTSGGIAFPTLSGGTGPVVTGAVSIGGEFLRVDAQRMAGAGSYDLTFAGVIDAYSTLDAHLTC